jgi:hypothetical protein
MKLLFAFTLLTAGCQSYESSAREEFSTHFSCPTDRVDVRARPDLDPRAVGTAAYCDVWEGRGCGQQSRFCCFRPKKNPASVKCSTVDYRPGDAKF